MGSTSTVTWRKLWGATPDRSRPNLPCSNYIKFTAYIISLTIYNRDIIGQIFRRSQNRSSAEIRRQVADAGTGRHFGRNRPAWRRDVLRRSYWRQADRRHPPPGRNFDQKRSPPIPVENMFNSIPLIIAFWWRAAWIYVRLLCWLLSNKRRVGGARPSEVEEQLDTLLASSARIGRLDSLHYAHFGRTPRVRRLRGRSGDVSPHRRGFQTRLRPTHQTGRSQIPSGGQRGPSASSLCNALIKITYMSLHSWPKC